MKFVSELPATELILFMDSIHKNGPIGGPLLVEHLTNYMIFVYKVAELLRPVQFNLMALDITAIHQCALDCGALKEKPTDGLEGEEFMNTTLYNMHMGTFFQRLASYVANNVKKLPQ